MTTTKTTIIGIAYASTSKGFITVIDAFKQLHILVSHEFHIPPRAICEFTCEHSRHYPGLMSIVKLKVIREL